MPVKMSRFSYESTLLNKPLANSTTIKYTRKFSSRIVKYLSLAPLTKYCNSKSMNTDDYLKKIDTEADIKPVPLLYLRKHIHTD